MIEIGYGFIRLYSALLFCGFLSLPEHCYSHPLKSSSSLLCVCIREFYFIALNLLFKQEKRFERARVRRGEIYEIVFFSLVALA
jgi:hypothetical protein